MAEEAGRVSESRRNSGMLELAWQCPYGLAVFRFQQPRCCRPRRYLGEVGLPREGAGPCQIHPNLSCTRVFYATISVAFNQPSTLQTSFSRLPTVSLTIIQSSVSLTPTLSNQGRALNTPHYQHSRLDRQKAGKARESHFLSKTRKCFFLRKEINLKTII